MLTKTVLDKKFNIIEWSQQGSEEFGPTTLAQIFKDFRIQTITLNELRKEYEEDMTELEQEVSEEGFKEYLSKKVNCAKEDMEDSIYTACGEGCTTIFVYLPDFDLNIIQELVTHAGEKTTSPMGITPKYELVELGE